MKLSKISVRFINAVFVVLSLVSLSWLRVSASFIVQKDGILGYSHSNQINVTEAKSLDAPVQTIVARFNTLYVGQTPNCNAGIVTNNASHLGCVNLPLGYTIKAGAAAQQLLYLGVTPNVNAGAITTKRNFRGGATRVWGYTMKNTNRLSGSTQLYVVVGCGNNAGEV